MKNMRDVVPGSPEMQEYEKLCQRNAWIKRRGLAFMDDPFLELDSPYSLTVVDDIQTLKEFFEGANWCVRQGVRYHDLVFANQVNGGDEWWTAKTFDGEWVPFESISMRYIIRDGKFESLIERLERATKEQCKTLTY